MPTPSSWLQRTLMQACWILSLIACLPTLPYAVVVMLLAGRAPTRRRRRW